MHIFSAVARAAIAAMLIASFGSAHAQQPYPNKPIHIIVAFPPGGSTDVVVRLLAVQLPRSMVQPVIVENRPGANGNIGANVVAKANPDGYTLLITPGTHVISRVLYPSAPFDPIADFEPVGTVVKFPYIIIANPRVPASNLRELIAYAKANPGKLSYGTAGQGTLNHLAMELLKQMAGIDILTVNYKGGAPALTDVIAGHIDLSVFSTTGALPAIRAGQLKVLATAADSRLADLPDIPTSAEAGLPGFTADGWFGILAPARTPRPIVERLNAEITKALQSPEMKEGLAKIGTEAFAGSPQEFAALMKKDQAKWAKLIQDLGIKGE